MTASHICQNANTDFLSIIKSRAWLLFHSKQFKGLVKDYAEWKIDLFCVFSKVPEFLLVAFKLLEIHWAAFFFRCFTLHFREKTYAKNPGSLARMQCFAAFIVETNKRFLLFLIQQEISKTCCRKKPGFLHTFFSQKRSIKHRKKCSPMYF